MRDQEQDAVRIAVHNAGHGRILVLGQRVLQPAGPLQLAGIGHHLAVQGVPLGLDQAQVIGIDADAERASHPADFIHFEAEYLGHFFRGRQTLLQKLLPLFHVKRPPV